MSGGPGAKCWDDSSQIRGFSCVFWLIVTGQPGIVTAWSGIVTPKFVTLTLIFAVFGGWWVSESMA